MSSKEKCLNNIMTVEDAATERGCSLHGIRKAIDEGRLVAVKKGRYWIIHRDDFKKFMGERECIKSFR